jgi:hypothetical protein
MAEASEVEVSTLAEAVAANSVQLPETRLTIWRKNLCARIT